MTRPDYFRNYADSLEIIRGLSDEQAGKLFKAKYEYMIDMTEPVFKDPTLKIIWSYEKAKMDRDFKGMYVQRVTGLYGVYCRDADPNLRLTIYDWVLWKKKNPLTDELQDKLFAMVEPEDFIKKEKPKKSNHSDEEDEYF